MIGKEIDLVKKNRKSIKVNIVNSFKSIFIYNPNIKRYHYLLKQMKIKFQIDIYFLLLRKTVKKNQISYLFLFFHEMTANVAISLKKLYVTSSLFE
jgi:hypothetical protein